MIANLQNRFSYPANALAEPVPTKEQLNEILQCAMAAPDHGKLQPWRFLIIEGDARAKLGQVFAKAYKKSEPDTADKKLEMIAEKPLRSPMIITVIASITEGHPKAPVVEQVLSAGAATQQILLGADALGFGAIWLSGPFAYDNTVKAALGVANKDEIVGFIYIGTPTIKKPERARPNANDFVSYWNGD